MVLLLVMALFTSCENTEACEEANSGTLILENKRSNGQIRLYVNPVNIGINTPGDLNVAPGGKDRLEVMADVHNIVVRLYEKACPDCRVQITVLDAKSIDVSTCEKLNLAY